MLWIGTRKNAESVDGAEPQPNGRPYDSGAVMAEAGQCPNSYEPDLAVVSLLVQAANQAKEW